MRIGLFNSSVCFYLATGAALAIRLPRQDEAFNWELAQVDALSWPQEYSQIETNQSDFYLEEDQEMAQSISSSEGKANTGACGCTGAAVCMCSENGCPNCGGGGNKAQTSTESHSKGCSGSKADCDSDCPYCGGKKAQIDSMCHSEVDNQVESAIDTKCNTCLRGSNHCQCGCQAKANTGACGCTGAAVCMCAENGCPHCGGSGNKAQTGTDSHSKGCSGSKADCEADCPFCGGGGKAQIDSASVTESNGSAQAQVCHCSDTDIECPCHG